MKIEEQRKILEGATQDERLGKEFHSWFMKLIHDKKHFPSCFWRNVVREFRKPMKEYFIKEAKRIESIGE